MIENLEEPIKGMREVLNEVTQAIVEMENHITPDEDGENTVKSRMSAAHNKLRNLRDTYD